MDRQRLLMIFGAAWVSAALLTWFLYARTKAPKQEETVKIVAAKRDLPIGTKISESDLHLVSVLRSQAPRSSLSSPKQALGRALVYPVSANEPLTDARLTSLSGAEGAAAILPQGMRAVSVQFNDVSGASGLIQPKSRVDVLYTRTGNVYEALTVTLLEDVEVLSIGRTTQVDLPQTGAATKKTTTVSSSNTNRTATLVVTPKQAQDLELAKNQGRIGLALRNPLDRSTDPEAAASTLEQIEPMILTRSSTNFRKRRVPGLNDAEWDGLTGGAPKKPKVEEPKPAPPKPRAVVDVFRGDKHVQEIFQ
ncbi:MAG: Flp pilus assembly protein CpaB [Bryobacteraceae bacterium]